MSDITLTRGLTMSEVPVDAEESDEFDDDLEFQPVTRAKGSWVTWVLVGLLIWGVGFLVGVLVDRSVAGLLG